ncbi:MAG TPA: hypothetical protein VGL94_13065 [Ktedonobacteraceae bacterium]
MQTSSIASRWDNSLIPTILLSSSVSSPMTKRAVSSMAKQSQWTEDGPRMQVGNLYD